MCSMTCRRLLRTFTRICGISIIVALSLSVPACSHTPPTVTTAEGQRAYHADQVVIRVNELQNAAIQAEATGGLPTDTTRTIVQFCVMANKTLATAPLGWPQTLLTAWTMT